MMSLKLEFPTLQREKDALDYINEFIKHKSRINGSGGLDKYNDYKAWLEMTINSHNGLPIEGRAASSTYFAVDDNNKIVGMCNIRHYLTKYLADSGSGHIGYGVRPLERKKGYGTQILKLSLLVCKNKGINEAMLGCYANNIASKKVIEKNGGILQKIIIDEEGIDNLVFKIMI